jgi:3-deoxy-manno-octulosonate cytidylyltransferase (CMP-KDO synthetase)
MLNKVKVIGIIPARFGSSRFPGKPLAMIEEKPMIQWVYEACSGVFDYITVATDDLRIHETVLAFGGHSVITDTEHRSGTDRCREALGIVRKDFGMNPGIVVNIQGDEPLVRQEQFKELLDCFDDVETEIATLVRHFEADEDPEDPNIVKAVVDHRQRALYFSRAPIPFLRNRESGPEPSPYLKHIGLYGFRADVLEKLGSLPPSPLERAESLEQLRWLENGYAIRTALTKYLNIGVDSPEDIEKIRNHLSGR